MLQGRELHLTDCGEQSNSWSDFFISLHSSFITLRHDDIHIVESYSPHRFSRQSGFCQDVPGKLIERTYDGSLKMLVQFWDFCVRLGGSSKVIVPTRPSEEGPLMTREYADWWSARRVHSSRQSTHIIFEVPRKDDIPLSSKDDQRQKNTHEGSSKSKLRSKDPSPSTKVLSKSTPSTGGDAHVVKGAKHVLLTSKITTAIVEVTNNPCKRKAPATSSNKDVAKTTNVVPTNEERTQAFALPNEIVNVSATSSSNKSDVSHGIHWNRSKKKAKDTSHSEFADLDALSIDTGFFVEGDPSSTMPFWASMSCIDVLGDNMVKDCVTSPNSLGVAAKSPHTSFDGVEHHAANYAPLSNLSLPKELHLILPEDVMLSKPAMTSKMDAAASQAKRQKAFDPTPFPLHLDAPNFKPQETISRIKLSFVNTMWCTLCEWIK
ncbi:hypothetical protein A4A49_04710 [Nicotiana attenuata]|uniref:Aminotransferase-like plant mobile domain-containing protein n=1 Tax=Nicotiana attenuata TaxID=49451 RepID=A0A1J6JAA5_NICAT|nr:hypothetical protein A4A49_04710 [Nicotiana attenuata]